MVLELLMWWSTPTIHRQLVMVVVKMMRMVVRMPERILRLGAGRHVRRDALHRVQNLGVAGVDGGGAATVHRVVRDDRR